MESSNGMQLHSKNIRESEEGVEVSLFLQNLKNIYNVNEVVGTYVCSKMKNFVNNYRHKTRRAIYEDLKANEIISSKVNNIIDTALKESNFERVFEYFSDAYYNDVFKENSTTSTCKIESLENHSFELPHAKNHSSLSVNTDASDEVHESASYDKGGSISMKTNTNKKTKRMFVQIKDESHILHLKEFNTVSNLKKILIQELNLNDELKDADIKYFDKDTKKWTVLKSWKLLETDGNIKISCSNKSEQHMHPHLELVKVPLEIETRDPPPLVDQSGNPNLPLEKRIEEVIEEYKSSGGKKMWVINFKLPQLDSKLTTALEKGDVITSSERMRICQTIHDYVRQYDSHTTPKEIFVIMKCLLLTFPKLVEMDKDYWVTWNIWKLSMENMFLKKKKHKTSHKASAKMKNTKRKSQSSASSSGEQKKKKVVSCVSSSKKAAMVVNLEHYLEVLNKEICSSAPCLENVSSAMDATFEERRRQIVSEGWSIEDIIISYPWLHNENEIFAEFFRIVKSVKEIDKAIDMGFRKIVYALLHILKTHNKSRMVTEKEKELRKEIDHKSNLHDFEYKMALFALPFSLGEDVDTIFKQAGSIYEEPIQIEYSGSDHFEDGRSYSVIVEDIRVECSSLQKAVAVFVASFFIFNLAYPSDIKKFLYFIERNLLNIPGKVLPPSQVVKMVGKINEYFSSRGVTWNE